MADTGNDLSNLESTDVHIRENSPVVEIEKRDVFEDPATQQPQPSTKTDQNIRQTYEKTGTGNEVYDTEPHSRNIIPNTHRNPQPARVTQTTNKTGELRSTASLGNSARTGRHDKQGSKPPTLSKAKNFIYMVIPPDGGYGWIILIVAFLCLIVVDGMIWTVGILLPAIANDLSLTATDVAFLASTQMAPLGSAFINKFGFRPVAFYGGVLAILAVSCSSFSTNLPFLILCYGVLAGSAMGMLLVTSVLIIHYYFERLRPIASSFASTGSGVGLVGISLMNVNMIESMGWRYTIRLHVLLLLAVTLLTCAYAEVEASPVGEFEYVPGEDSEESLSSVEIAIENYSVYSLPKTEAEPTNDDVLQGPSSSFNGRSTSRHWCCRRLCSCCCRDRMQKTRSNKPYVINRDPLDRQDIFYSGPPDYSRSYNMQGKDWKPIQVVPGEEKAQSIGYTLSVIRPGASTLSANSLSCIPAKLKVAIRTLFDFKLIKLTEFKLLLLYSLVFPMGLNIPFVYSISRAEIPEHLANLLPAIIGTFNVMSRILLGFCAFKTTIHPSYLSGFGLCLGGSVVLLSGFTGKSSVHFQFVFAMMFGVALASYGGLRSVIYVKVLGLERLTNAYGLTTATMGVGTFVGTYLSGVMLDHFHSYQPAFIFSGVCIVLAGIIQLTIPKYMAYSLALKQRKMQKRVRFTGTKRKWSECWGLCF